MLDGKGRLIVATTLVVVTIVASVLVARDSRLDNISQSGAIVSTIEVSAQEELNSTLKTIDQSKYYVDIEYAKAMTNESTYDDFYLVIVRAR